MRHQKSLTGLPDSGGDGLAARRPDRAEHCRNDDHTGATMHKLTASLFAAALLSAGPAFASDLPAMAAPAAKPAAAPTNGTTIGLELSPEFFADPANAKYGQINDAYFKGTITQ